MVAPPYHAVASRASSGKRPATSRSRVSRQSSLNALATSRESTAAPGSFSSVAATVRCISSMPFFLGLGVHKPHLPWAVPGSFFDLCKFQPPAYSSGSLVAQQTTWRNASLSVTLMVFRCDFKSNESECAVCCRLQTRR